MSWNNIHGTKYFPAIFPNFLYRVIGPLALAVFSADSYQENMRLRGWNRWTSQRIPLSRIYFLFRSTGDQIPESRNCLTWRRYQAIPWFPLLYTIAPCISIVVFKLVSWYVFVLLLSKVELVILSRYSIPNCNFAKKDRSVVINELFPKYCR